MFRMARIGNTRCTCRLFLARFRGYGACPPGLNFTNGTDSQPTNRDSCNLYYQRENPLRAGKDFFTAEAQRTRRKTFLFISVFSAPPR
jgi:hypothetical protein